MHLNKPVKAKELMRPDPALPRSPLPAAQASIRPPAPPAGRDCRPSSWSTTTARCARRCAICSEEDGRTVELYASCEAFLEAYRPGREGCLLVDARMPGMGGLELLQRLQSEGIGCRPS